jgi:hypothetical protein
MADKTIKTDQKWTVLATLSYPDASGKKKTVDAGTVVSDIPSISVKWLAAQGFIKEI